MHDGRIEWWWATYVRIFRHHCWYYCLLKSVCVCLCCARVCVHADSLWDSTKPWKPPGVLPACGGPPLFSLKAATVQLRLRYTTMWQSHTRANICDLDATFKYGPIDGSFFFFFFFPRLYFTSLNANWFPAVCSEERGCGAVGGLAAAVLSQTSPCLSHRHWSGNAGILMHN